MTVPTYERMLPIGISPLDFFQLLPLVEVKCVNFECNRGEVLQMLDLPMRKHKILSSKWNYSHSSKTGLQNVKLSEQKKPNSHFFLVDPEMEWKLLQLPGQKFPLEKVELNHSGETKFLAELKIPDRYTPGGEFTIKHKARNLTNNCFIDLFKK